jgi:hypothetical protein
MNKLKGQVESVRDKRKSSIKSIRRKPLSPVNTNIKVDRYIPCWDGWIIKLGKDKDYWKRFEMGNRTFVKTFNPGMDYLMIEIVKMTQQEFNIIKESLKWK